MIKIHSFKNGMTVAELKEAIKDWPNLNEDGEPNEVWVDGNGYSNRSYGIWPLNKRIDANGNEFADIILTI